MKKIIPFIIILILVIIIRNLATSTYSLIQNTQELKKRQEELALKRKGNQFLNERIYYANDPEFIEQEAREKLGLVKKGEKIVLVAPPEKAREAEKKDNRDNWEKWLKMFL